MEDNYDIREDLGGELLDDDPTPEIETKEEEKEEPRRRRRKEEPKEEKDVEEDPPKTITPKTPRGGKICWACVECGMTWGRPKLSCSACGGPVQRMSSDQVKGMVIRNRRRRGIPSP
jgi:hypothetical protein